MKSHPGIAARTFATLRDLGLEPELVATSPIKIAFYIPQGEVERAVRSLHDAFELSSAEAERGHS
jgi:aspartate kinase